MTSLNIILLILGNTAAWLIIHLGFAWGGTQIPYTRFNPDAWWYRTFRFEREGNVYERLFGIRHWKDRLPDGAGWFKGGFRKKSLRTANRDYLERFLIETCRGELIHWAVLCAGGLFFIWNPVDVALGMLVYATAANLPCIIIQRYNRVRIRAILARKRSH